ncbi:MAG: SurA N-terminal domain-containing protein [Proteobacteria bacterium]|nr:SurA N-terminal domain-containing protein [Pseudomonadota bacterium]
MKARGAIFIAGCAIVIAFACFAPRAEAATQVLNSVVAVVNDDVITQRQLDQAMRTGEKKNPRAITDPISRQRAIDELIDERLMGQILAKSQIAVSEDDLARAIAGIIHQNGISIDGLRREVASKGMTWEEYRKEVEEQIKRVKFVNQVIGPQVKITDQDLRDYYRQNQERFRGGVRAHIAQIFLPFENFQSQADVEAYKDGAFDIAARARRGDFRELARKNSKGANAEGGGDMGMVDIKDLPEAVGAHVKNMAQGEVSPPIPIDKGLVIVKMIALPELSASDFEKLRDDIYSVLYERRVQETLRSYLQKERSKAYIEIM